MITNPFAHIEFERSDLDSIHDTLMNATDNGLDISDAKIIEYFQMLPDTIKYDAMKWGVSDTPTREAMFLWFKENVTI